MSYSTILRSQIITKAKQGFGDGLNKTPYNQSVLKNGYRADCSGFVSRCWGLTSAVGNGWWGGLNTVTLVTSGIMKQISMNDLKPGDACGNCGTGTAGDDGHVVLFDKWYNTDPNNNDYYIYEQCGGTVGPIHRKITWPYPGESNWKAYRFVGAKDDPKEPTVYEPAPNATWDYLGIPAPKDSASYDDKPYWTGAGSLAEAVRASRSAEDIARANSAKLDQILKLLQSK